MSAHQPVVLGLNLGHDRAACLAIGGAVRVAIAEERLSRLRHDIPTNERGELMNRFPDRAVEYCLRAADLGYGDVDAVFASTTYVLQPGRGRRNLTPDDVRWQCPQLAETRIEVVPHHLAHAASAALCCGEPTSTVLVVDGGGSVAGWNANGEADRFERTSIFRCVDGRLELLKGVTGGPPTFGNSIGDFYQVISRYLGFRSGDEGKLMGLAGMHPYPRPEPLEPFHEAIVVATDGDHEVAAPFEYTAGTEGFHESLIEWFGPPRKCPRPDDPLDCHIAASAQWALEEAMLKLSRVARGLAGTDALCLAGGVALNCLANERIARETRGSVFIQPAASDDGTALGNALLGWTELGGDPSWRLETAYLGHEYGAAEIEEAIRGAAGAVEVQPDGSPERLADDIAAGNIVAVMRGPSEFGPRALGHRSILCDPRRAEMKDRLNLRVKHRETFRPFAPMVLAERASDFFEIDRPSPHMLLAARVRRPHAIPAVTHVDGSARVQTVAAEQEDYLWSTLRAFERRTDVPVLLNTSFNDREPIVETPVDAVRCFLATGIDVLHLGDLRLGKRD